MLRFLLDTNVLSEPLTKTPDRALLRKLHEHGSDSATASLVVHELRFGASLLEPSRRREAIERYIDEVILRVYSVLPYDRAAADWHASERARLQKLGKSPPFVDGQIAAIARANDLVLVTANVKDYRGYKGLKVENWRAAAR